MNSTILRAQLWELFRLTWPELFVRFLLPLALITFVARYTSVVEYFTVTFLLECLLLASLTSTLWVRSFDQRAPGAFPVQLGFVHPLPTPWLAVLPLGWLMLTNTALYVILAALTQFMLDQPFPILSMVPFILLTTAGIATVAWSSNRFVERIIGATLLGLLAITWFQGRLSVLDSLTFAPVDWAHAFRPTLLESALALFGTLVFSLLCIVLVRRQRHGDTEPLLGWRELFKGSFADRLERRKDFRTARSAQLWFEYRRVGTRGAAITLAALLTLAAAVSANATGATTLALILFYMALSFAPFALPVAVVEGTLGVYFRGQSRRLSPFEATQPRTDLSSILLKLEVALGVTLAGWLTIGLAFLLTYFALMSPETSGQSPARWLEDLADIPGSLPAQLVIVYALLITACATALLLLMALGYVLPLLRQYTTQSFVLANAALLPVNLDIIQKATGRDLQPLHDLWFVALGIFLIGVTAVSLVKLHREGLARPRLILGVTFCWLILLATALRFALDGGLNPFQFTTPTVCFAAGLLALPLAAFAWAPLSLATLRHQ